jgi:YidC/Oxa1 family membrane protein insertase
MENKTTITGMLALFLLCMGYWLFLVLHVYPTHPNWDYNNTLNQPPPATAPSSVATSTSGPSEGSFAATEPTTMASAVFASTQPAGPPVSIGSSKPGDPTYALAMQIDPKAAGLNSVTINSLKNADMTGLYMYQQPIDATSYASMATRSVTVDGQTIDLSGANWQPEASSTRQSATLSLDIFSPNKKPLLRIEKTYRLSERGPVKNRDNTPAGYETSIDYRLVNLSGHALKDVRVNFDGPTMPQRDMERYDDRQFVGGYDKGDSNIDLTRDTLSEFKPGTPPKDLTTYKNQNLLWVGESSNYFAAIIQPEKVGLLGNVQLSRLNPDDINDEAIVGIHIQTAGVAIPAGSSADLPMSVFFGPKIRSLFEGDFYGVYPRLYNQLLGTSSSMCGICALPWLIDVLIDLLRAFHFVLRDWGLAIIALVVLVRAILHPISKSSQVSMLKLQKMGPEMERLKKKFGDDKEALSKAQMEMHKEMGITPFLGCLPMFLQMPIWIALYSALQSDIALRQAPFLWGYTWIHDLSRPDRLIHWDAHPFIVPFFGMKLMSLNILPLIVAVLMFVQQKMQPQAPSVTPEQQSQQKMMRYMSLAFSLFFYWMPSGLNLYILTSSTIAIFESKIIRDHIKEREAREKSGKVIVDAKPTRKGKQTAKQQPVEQDQKSGCLGSAWSNLQERAEQIRREAERKSKR